MNDGNGGIALTTRITSKGVARRLAVWVVVFVGAAAGAQDRVNFTRQIQPLLSENCYYCHGPDADHRKGDLRLDTADGAAAVLSPGKPNDSELLRRLLATNDSERMPPPNSNRRLTPEQVDLVKRWIEQGAEWSEHWSFARITEVVPPEVSSEEFSHWRSNPIDRFLLARLLQERRTPSPRADKETLIRRVTLDLTGLPPTPEEVDAFLADESPNAYEVLVDRLLQSPAYGERMAWNWLDAARYADSNGYQGDRERTMWPWRDWVIKAFNDNLPFDKFTVWQVAGDLLPEATFEQKLATGFFRNHMINGEGGRIPEENRIEYVFDMTETLGTVWLGLTLNCCRCHDHKFDPLTRKNYYELFAFFNQTPVDGGGGDPQTAPAIPAPTREQQERLAVVEANLQEARTALEARARELAAGQPIWEQRRKSELNSAAEWTGLSPSELHADHQELSLIEGNSVLASGPNPANDTYRLTYPIPLTTLTGLRLEALRHPSMTAGGLARSDSGNFVLTEIELALRSADGSATTPIKIASAEATFEQGDLKVTKSFDGDSRSGWAVHEGRPVDKEHAAVFRFSEPVPVPAGASLLVTLKHDSPHVSHNLGRFRISVTSTAEPKLGNEQDKLLIALNTDPTARDEQQKKLVRDGYLASDEQYRKLTADRESLDKQLQEIRNAIPKVMVMEDRKDPRKTFMLTKGLYNKPEDEVTAATPASLPPLPENAPRNRLTLAEWLVSDANPLAARVTVNRFWQQFFGIGLVKTPEDFGAQGEVPVQLDLMNWLAYRFRESGWDVKGLVRLMVTSEAYKQSSKSNPADIERDPENRFLSRGPRYRLPSWMIRDQALAISGLLVPKIGGPSVNGYQPPGIWEEATFGFKKYQQDSGEALYRRSLYTFWRRIVAPTMFFDVATRQTCAVVPVLTNTPLHALVTLNDITFVEASRKMAERVLTHSANDAERLTYAFRLATARRPQAKEADVLLARLERLKTQYKADAESAIKLLSVGESKRNESLDPAELAAWTGICSLILNLDETLTKQ